MGLVSIFPHWFKLCSLSDAALKWCIRDRDGTFCCRRSEDGDEWLLIHSCPPQILSLRLLELMCIQYYIQHIFFLLLIATPVCVLEEKTTSPSWLRSGNLVDCCNGAGIISLVNTTSDILLVGEFWQCYCTKKHRKADISQVHRRSLECKEKGESWSAGNLCRHQHICAV